MKNTSARHKHTIDGRLLAGDLKSECTVQRNCFRFACENDRFARRVQLGNTLQKRSFHSRVVVPESEEDQICYIFRAGRSSPLARAHSIAVS